MTSPRRGGKGTPGKSPQTLDHCHYCGITYLKRHGAKHHSLCNQSQPFSVKLQSNNDGPTHGFLHDGTMYCRTKLTQRPPDVDKLDGWVKRNIVFLSSHTMQLCQVTIGDYVAILQRDPVWSPAIVWPDDALETFELGTWEGSIFPANVSCRLRKATVFKTAEVVLITDDWKQLYESGAFRVYCANFLRTSALYPDATVCIPYFGMDCHFKASVDEANAIPLLMSDMDVSDRETSESLMLSASPCVFYSILTNTTISIRRSKPNISATVRFANLVGLRQAKDDLNRYIVFPVRLFNSGRIQMNDFQFRTILFYGPPGCGKSTLALATANESGASLKVINAETLSKLELAVQATTIFLLDDVDRMAKPAAVDSIVKVLSQVRACLHPALLIATVQKRSNLIAEIRSLFDVEVEIPVPTATERRELVEALASSRPNSLTKADFDDIALMSQGCTYSDLKSLFKEALCSLQTLWYLENNNRAVLNRDLLLKAAKKVHPSAMREITLDIPQVKWADIGGEMELKQKLQQMVEWPLRHPDAFQRLGIRPPKGILMYGPPGCSKTMIARALATESNLNFIAVKGPELFSKYVGESEKAVREIFRKARQVAPAVIFFDEIDALASSRSQEQAGVGNRVLAQLLTEMDGIEPLNEVIIVAATNRPDMIDDALLRPGRLDRIVAVPLPDESTRRDILNIRLGRMPIGKNVDIEKLVKATDAFSGAEVSSLCDEAALMAMQEDFDANEVCLRHFDQAFKIVRPRTSKKLLDIYEEFQRRAPMDAR
ncbi:hypothetical protein M514_07153 [Trichuris suis]|uniref:AAA+ ATPase domain-containing protein n=1 Tax=Trichuris suis TaxID=68888 RepID=A0A085NPG7_9BILA|nr:hypothetical protein M513_07153 [Trichuris suis]KFD71363.1 hypothetical protein M514_07153 [Trichuris suis]KHJ48960.1 hypothetical protein D918_00066 [Trichuris suis]